MIKKKKINFMKVRQKSGGHRKGADKDLRDKDIK